MDIKQIEKQVERICSSKEFSKSDTHSKLLRYIVTNSVSGRNIKEISSNESKSTGNRLLHQFRSQILRTIEPHLERRHANEKTYVTGINFYHLSVPGIHSAAFIPNTCISKGI